jgi:hypothetical protein
MNFEGLIYCVLIAGVGTLIGYFWYQRIKKKRETAEAKEKVKEEEPPRPTKRKAMMAVVVINNKTDKEYVVKSENDFGLNWGYSENRKEPSNYSLLRINQLHSLDKENGWTGVSRFLDFSVKSTVWEEFDIVYDDKKEEVK